MARGLKKLLLYFTGALFFVSACTLLPLIYTAYQSKSWPTVTATITKSSISADAPGGLISPSIKFKLKQPDCIAHCKAFVAFGQLIISQIPYSQVPFLYHSLYVFSQHFDFV